VRHFYHVWAAGAWAAPAVEHMTALAGAGFCGQVTVGLVGPPGDRTNARRRLAPLVPDLGGTLVEWVDCDEGSEQVTLTALRAWVHANPDDVPVLYAHTKGARDQSTWNTNWRRSMTEHVVTDWRRCVSLLAAGYDTVGCHWIRPGDHDCPHETTSPFYGGNFWWANASYLRRLPPVANASRFDAEAWIGLADPHAYDLRPGWPSEDMFATADKGVANAVLK